VLHTVSRLLNFLETFFGIVLPIWQKNAASKLQRTIVRRISIICRTKWCRFGSNELLACTSWTSVTWVASRESPQQLIDEISRGLWKAIPGTAPIVFDPHPETLWQRVPH
jgi:hypothetical protein